MGLWGWMKRWWQGDAQGEAPERDDEVDDAPPRRRRAEDQAIRRSVLALRADGEAVDRIEETASAPLLAEALSEIENLRKTIERRTDVVLLYQRERDQWQQMWHRQWRSSAEGQALLETELIRVRTGFVALVNHINEERKKRDEPALTHAEVDAMAAPIGTHARFVAMCEKLEDDQPPKLEERDELAAAMAAEAQARRATDPDMSR